MNFRPPLRLRLASALFLAASPALLHAWDYEGHRMVNQSALASAGASDPSFPKFVFEPANAERIAYLAGEPDRWRAAGGDLPLKEYNSLDHFINLEQLARAGLGVADVSPLRYRFALQFATGRAAHSDRFAPIDPAKNQDHTMEWCGFLPWAIREYEAKLRSSFNSLKTLEANGGSAEEIANAQASIVAVMGLMGHYVGDGSQPLHTTIHHHGWVGPNPEGYTTDGSIHEWIDGAFIRAAGITEAGVLPKVSPTDPIVTTPLPDGRDPIFAAIMDYLVEQQKKVVFLYEMEKAGKFQAPKGRPANSEGVAFIQKQLALGGEMLASLWLTAWRDSAPDPLLRTQFAPKTAPAAGR